MKKNDKFEQEKIAQEVLEAFKGFRDLKNAHGGGNIHEKMGEEILNEFQEFVDNTDYTPKHVHSGAAIASIVANTMKMAAANPHIENHSTYIVSFPARIVTQIKVNKGTAICIDKGYIEKKK